MLQINTSARSALPGHQNWALDGRGRCSLLPCAAAAGTADVQESSLLQCVHAAAKPFGTEKTGLEPLCQEVSSVA